MGSALAPSREDICHIVTHICVDTYCNLGLPCLWSL